MMESLDSYKKTLEDYLQKVDFIYSGDVTKSENISFMCGSKEFVYSSTLIRSVMIDIYNWSFSKMIDNSKEIIIHRNNFTDIYNLIDSIPNFDPKILFYSKNSNLNLNLGSHVLEEEDGKGYLPSYFNRRFKLMSFGKEVSAYYSPQIEDDVDDCCFYLVDKSIQSMVWIIQNMTYNINRGLISNEHYIKYPIYHCDYESYKIRVVNTQKLREDKINSILNDN